MRKINKEQEQEIIQLYQSGMGSDIIARKFCIHPNSILKILKKNNITRRQNKSSLDHNFIIQSYISGLSMPKIAEQLNVSSSAIRKILKKHNVPIRDASKAHRKYEIYEDFFDKIDSEDKAYFLGFLYADGYNCKKQNYVSVGQEISDKDIIKKLAHLIYKINPEQHVKIQDRTKDKKGITAYFTINSKHICKQLDKLGCPQNKTFLLQYPLWLPEHLHRHFIRGYFDGDGDGSTTIMYAINKGSKFKLTSTEQFCVGAQNIIKNQLNIHINYYKHTTADVFELIACGDRNVLLLLDWMYNNSNIHMQRKYNLYIELKNKINNTNALSIIGTQGYPKSTISKTNHIDTSLIFNEIAVINDKRLTADYLKTLSIEERENLIEPIFQYFRQIGWRYPDDLSKIKTSYHKLINKSVDINQSELHNNDSLATNICKHFCHSFYTSAEKNKLNMIDIFNDDVLLKKVISNRLGIGWKKPEFFSISHKMLIQGMRSMRLVPMISIFKPFIAKYICSKYSEVGDTVFDYSAGFGGRMLGAASCNRKYIGVDPLTTPELVKMKSFLNLPNCTLIKTESENFKGETNSVDLVWSSPPYYDQEYYSSKSSQAYNKDENYFYNVYWANTLNNCKNILKPNKWFGLNVKNVPKMLEMAINIFGPIQETITLKTYTSHLNKTKSKNEYIYMFINKK